MHYTKIRETLTAYELLESKRCLVKVVIQSVLSLLLNLKKKIKEKQIRKNKKQDIKEEVLILLVVEKYKKPVEQILLSNGAVIVSVLCFLFVSRGGF